MVRTSGNKYRKLVRGFLYCKLMAERAKMRWICVIRHANDMYCGGLETEISLRSWIQMIIHKNSILAANNNGMQLLYNC
jgi:hypothetical protein